VTTEHELKVAETAAVDFDAEGRVVVERADAVVVVPADAVVEVTADDLEDELHAASTATAAAMASSAGSIRRRFRASSRVSDLIIALSFSFAQKKCSYFERAVVYDPGQGGTEPSIPFGEPESHGSGDLPGLLVGAGL